MCKSSVYFSIHQTFAPKTPLSCQGEFQGDTEIAGGGGIGTAGEQRGVRLLIIVGGDGHQATQGVIGHKRDFDGTVAAGGRGGARGDVAGDGGLTAEGDV